MSGLILISLTLAGLTTAANSPYADPHCEKGSVGFVHLFEWRWSDIEKECPRLSQIGFCGVQTSIPTEHLLLYPPSWLERYEPVSYKLISRSGDENEFYSMVQACGAVGIRIFVTLQLDHMSPGDAVGYNGSVYNATTLDYPGVPFNANHFHTEDDCSNPRLSPSSSPSDMQKCWALGYPDLDQANPYVRDTLINLLNKFISMGVSGFFLTNAIHIAPEDLLAILDQVHDVTVGGRPYMAYEIVNTLQSSIDPRWFYPIGRVTDYSMSEVLGKAILEDQDLSGLCLLLNSSTVLIPREYASVLPAQQAVVFVHDVNYQRGISLGGVKVVTYKDPEYYKLALSFMFATGYGIPKVMSSYDFMKNDQGPPIDDEGEILEVSQKTGQDCGNGWICEHRFPDVEYMITFNSMFRDQEINNCKSEKTKVSFSRGDKGHYWATLGPVDQLKDDLPKVRTWDEQNEEYVEQLETDGLKLLEFGGLATVAFYTETFPMVALPEESTTVETATSEPTIIESTTLKTTTIASTMGESTTNETMTSEPTIIESTTEATTIKASMAESATNKPTTADLTNHEPSTTNPRTQKRIQKLTTNQPKSRQRRPTEVTRQPTTLTTSKPTTTETTRKAKKPKPSSDFQRTVIFIQQKTEKGEKIFIRGRNGDPGVTDKRIPIKHLDLEINLSTPERDQWVQGDDFLDWNGRETDQHTSTYGTPAQWTSKLDKRNYSKYQSPLNTYGDHYWMVDVMMDCSRTHQGFFEVRGLTQNRLLESSRNLGIKCEGGEPIPRKSNYHLGMCGKLNVFSWGEKKCAIKAL
ncbi:hypothetical protein RRG08_023993 [Elysia crispata]|uniref:alpha-amylase n=1 Tax=Elysia crispata TaxID=231223 RepID=A0AAE0YNA4_9GAST|nr:hypothetical protein RRG08_023993 [Elysia crispata]